MNDLDRAQQTVGEWGAETFPNANWHSITAHLSQEVAELVEAAPDDIAEEAADCLLLLLNLAHREGFSLYDAAQAKHAVNVGRTWETDAGAKGYRKHAGDDHDR